MQIEKTWICSKSEMGDVCPIFSKMFDVLKPIKKAVLTITAIGVYEAHINGERVGQFILAPGWSVYKKRLQYQTYDITSQLSQHNILSVTVGKGWYHSPMATDNNPVQCNYRKVPIGLWAKLTITYEDNSQEILQTDESWNVCESAIRFSELYDGEVYDASFNDTVSSPAICFEGPSDTLILQQGEEIREQERLKPIDIFVTPKGEYVVDFGQNMTGYVQIDVDAKAGDRVAVSFAEVMDRDGNFYNENYRKAKAKYQYICKNGVQSCKPVHTFYGFRYIRLDQFPGGADSAKAEQFTAIAVYSDMERTGYISSSDSSLNQLFSNVIWGQRSNFLDVPTDCPQRDERLGWTGDAQVFIRTAGFNYHVKRFFEKWLADMAADQRADGAIGYVIPDLLQAENGSAGWGDAAVICPWELFMAYGDKELLASHYDMMTGWVNYIATASTTPDLWTGTWHFGDWLGLDAPSGSYKGSSRDDFIASAFYAYSTSLVIRAGKELEKDVSEYEKLYKRIKTAFLETFPTYNTQTECVLAAHFHLAKDEQEAADLLAKKIKACGGHLETGFIGTPYLLHVLSEHGYSELAYSLLLRKEYPSWLYSVSKGATTIWEHWDGIHEDGSFWSTDMNSFNHYAYGSVMDWVYGVAAGIKPLLPGYRRVQIAPIPDKRLKWLNVSYQSECGLIRSNWKIQDKYWRYEIETPVETEIMIGQQKHIVSAGSYVFYQKIEKIDCE